MKKLNYLNLGCGSKFHKDWYNIDMSSNSSDVIAVNLLKGIPFPDKFFDVVYHSQVLEHIPKEKAHDFIKECFRVLKPNGIIRIAVPDLENIVDEYKKFLNENLQNPNELSSANYDWILIEMYDQTVRNYSGGQMTEFLKQTNLINEKYIIERIGYDFRSISNSFLRGDTLNTISGNFKRVFLSPTIFKKAFKFIFRKIKQNILSIILSEKSKIGSFRMGGQVHMWMYDRYSLSRLLKECGFEEISIKSPIDSAIPKWEVYELDVKDGLICDPTSLFIEARKITLNKMYE